MTVRSIVAIAFVGVLGLAGLAGGADAQPSCGPEWALPGEYYVSGNFRGRNESTVIRLSSSCRVHFQVPGVFSGGPVQASGECVRFSFKVRGEKRPLEARWCDDVGTVPWNGREIQVKVWQSRRQQAKTATF
jgi:hypothetical protein